MKVLVACEESGAVTAALLERGVDAWSCDLLPTRGQHPERHFQEPVQRVLKYGGWDAIIGFPPCTHLSNAGQKYRAEKLADGRLLEGYNFFMSLWEYPARCKALENPLGIVSSQKQLDTFLPGRVALQPSQIVCWTDFGDTRKKRTCLWLDGLPCLLPTTCRNERARSFAHWAIGSCPGRSRQRSVLSVPFAQAMAEQWADILRR